MRWRVPACVLVLAAAAAPQARGARAPGRTLSGDRLAMVAQVLQAARRSAEAAPAWAAPQLLIAVARAELPQFREQSLADDRAAFRLALALPTPASLDPAGAQAPNRFQEQIKQNAELEAVSAVARDSSSAGASAPGPAPIDAALALIRLADVPKAPLYDQLLLAARMPSATAQALVRDCELSGAYPYRGAAAWLARKRMADFDRIAFVQDGYTHAGDETDPSAMSAAVMFLQAGHRVAPELDAALEAASTALLRRIGQNENVDAADGGYAAQHGAAIRLQALLRQIDPAQAVRLAADYPDLAAAPGTGGNAYTLRAMSSGGVAIAFQPPSLTARAAAAEPAPAAAFQGLVMRAERDQRANPDAALAEANQAADLLDTDLSAGEAPAAARLALVYAAVGDSADAAKWMSACLDAAGRAAFQADTEFDQAGDDGQAQQALHLEAENWQVTAIYGDAAQLDFATAVQRAESANFTLDKPLVLARIALMAELSRAH